MSGPTGNTALGRDSEPVESVTAEINDQTSLIEAFENTLEISQDVDLKSAASEETDSREKPEQEDGQRDGQRDEQQDRQRDGQRDEQRDEQQDGQRDEQQDGQRDEQQDRQRDGQQDGQRDGQSDGQRDGQPDGQRDGQSDGQTVHPPAAESSSTESKWEVGAQCRVVWSEDGRVYPATVVSLDGERCRVRFNGYGNQEDVELSMLKSPDAAAPQTKSSPDWRPGSRCRAVYSEDSLVYPAVVLWVKGQRCRVRFDDYNNEEEQDIANLLHLDELHGPSRATAAKGSNWKSSVSSSNLDWKRRREENQGERGGERRRREENQGERGGERRRREENQGERGGERWRREENQGERGGERWRREENQGERGGERWRREENQGERGGERWRREENQGERGGERRSAWREEEQNSSWVKEKASDLSKEEKEAEEKKRGGQAEKPTNHSFSFFPPCPPPHQSGSGDPVSIPPPPPPPLPPPLWSFAGSSAGVDSPSSMLMLWYMCGFHTGSYMAQQVFKSNSKD